MSRDERDGRGFSYYVSDEQLAAFAAVPWEKRLDWVDETRATLIALASDEVKARWARLRRGEPIDGDALEDLTRG